MQDNPFDKKFMDDAWSQMNNQLDEVMPPKRKRRFVFWWWFLPSLGAASILVLMLLPKSVSPNQPTELITKPQKQIQSEQPIADLATKKSISPANNKPAEPINNSTKEVSEQNQQTTKPQNHTTEINHKTNKPQNQQTNNNPIIPVEQDPVTKPAFQDPEAIVLHTATEVPQSDQRVANAVPVTDLRFLTPFSPLNSSSFWALSLTDQTTVIFNATPIKVSKLYNRRGTAAAFLSAGYNTQHGQTDFSAGLGWKQQKGRFFLRLEPGFHLGATVLTAARNNNQDNAAMDVETGGNTALEPNFDTQAEAIAGSGQNNLAANFSSLSIPLTLGYQFKSKWSLEGGLQWSHALSLRASQTLNTSSANRFQNGATPAFSAGDHNANLKPFLESNSWLEGRMAINYRWSNRLELQAAYRFGQVNIAESNLAWNRDQYALRLRYRLR